MDILHSLEKTIEDLAYTRAVKKCQKIKSIKTWGKRARKILEYREKEIIKIINNIVNFIKEKNDIS